MIDFISIYKTRLLVFLKTKDHTLFNEKELKELIEVGIMVHYRDEQTFNLYYGIKPDVRRSLLNLGVSCGMNSLNGLYNQGIKARQLPQGGMTNV